MIIEDQKMLVHQEMVKERVLTLQKERKSFLKEMMLEHFLIPIIQNISVKNEQIIHQQKVKEKNLILKRGRKNLKIEADQNLLSLKNIKEIGTNQLFLTFSFLSFLFSFKDNLGFFIKLESLNDLPLYLFDMLFIIRHKKNV